MAESEVSLLHQKLLEKDRIISDLEEYISNLTLASQQVLQENAKLSKERDELAATMKKLSEDFSKLSKERNVLPASATKKNLGEEFSKVKLANLREEIATYGRKLGHNIANGPVTLTFGTCERLVPKAYPDIVRLGRPSKIDAEEFLTEVRSRLSDKQLRAFDTIILEIYHEKQTREEGLRIADEMFGPDNKDLYLRLERFLCWNLC